MKKVPFKQLLFSVLLIALITSCKKNIGVETPDFKRQELIKEVSESLVRTSVFLKENYDKESLNQISFFSKKKTSQKSIQSFTTTYDEGVSLLDIQASMKFDSLLQSSVNLLEYEGVYDSLITEFGNSDPSSVIVSAMIILANEGTIDNNGTSVNSYGIDSQELGNCMLRTLGFGSAGFGIESWGWSRMSVRGIVGMVAKVAARFVGPFFVAFAMWDLADCLIYAQYH